MVACTQLISFFFLSVLTGYHFRMMSVYLPFLRPLLRFLCSSLRAVSPFRAFYPFVLQRDRPSVYKLDICIYTHPVVSTYACLYLVICSFIYVFYLFRAFPRVFILVFSARRHFRRFRCRRVHILRRRLLRRRFRVYILQICVFISFLLICFYKHPINM